MPTALSIVPDAAAAFWLPQRQDWHLEEVPESKRCNPGTRKQPAWKPSKQEEHQQKANAAHADRPLLLSALCMQSSEHYRDGATSMQETNEVSNLPTNLPRTHVTPPVGMHNYFPHLSKAVVGRRIARAHARTPHQAERGARGTRCHDHTRSAVPAATTEVHVSPDLKKTETDRQPDIEEESVELRSARLLTTGADLWGRDKDAVAPRYTWPSCSKTWSAAGTEHADAQGIISVPLIIKINKNRRETFDRIASHNWEPRKENDTCHSLLPGCPASCGLSGEGRSSSEGRRPSQA
jgi:hypothetical protein